MRRKLIVAAIVAGLVGSAGVAVAATDFGTYRDSALASKSQQQFGVGAPLASSSTSSVSAQAALANPAKLVTLAQGLQAHAVTSGVASPNIDQMVLWPNDVHPTWIIACNEQEEAEPGLVRINLATGAQTTIVTGTVECDPVRATAWGTILFGEEDGGGPNGGRMYELLDPIGTTGVTLDRTTGVFSGGTGASNLAPVPALGRLSFEGLALYPNGLLYYGDENRPSTGTAGGAYFRFVPAHPYDPSEGPIIDLADSPLRSGSISGLRLGLRSGGTDYGQGTNSGLGTWVPVPNAPDPDLRAQAAALHLSGFYRPEDASVDPVAQAAGNVRWCGYITGNESNDHLWGETICVTDGTIAQAMAGTSTPDLQQLVVGNPEFAMMDNIAYQPGRGNWLIHEDGDGPTSTPQRNNDLWDCLPDGPDADLQSDGCIRVASINDLVGADGEGAEWTGGVFDATGTRFFVSIQHNVTGFGTILEIDGWK